MNKPGKVFVAKLEHYYTEFIAVGKTEKEAKAAIRRAWKAVLVGKPDFDEIQVTEMKFGDCLHDGTVY